MVHGIGQRLQKSNLVDDVGNFRHITSLAMSPDFIPTWHSKGPLYSMPGKRSVLCV